MGCICLEVIISSFICLPINIIPDGSLGHVIVSELPQNNNTESIKSPYTHVQGLRLHCRHIEFKIFCLLARFGR